MNLSFSLDPGPGLTIGTVVVEGLWVVGSLVSELPSEETFWLASELFTLLGFEVGSCLDRECAPGAGG